MTIKKLICLLVLTLMTTPVSAIESWNGSKFIYSTSLLNSYAIKVELRENGVALVVSTDGTATGTFDSKDGKIEITLIEKTKQIGFPIRIIPGTDRVEQVFMERELDKLIIGGVEDGAFLTETWTSCFEYRIDDKQCETHTETSTGQFLIRDFLASVSITFSYHDNILIPLPNHSLAFVTIEDLGGKVSPVDSSVEDNHLVKKVSKVIVAASTNIQVKVELTDGSKIIFGETRTIEGLSRVVGVQTLKNGGQKLVKGLLVVDQKVDSSRLDPSGLYKSFLSGDQINSYAITYEFNPNGFGGFEFTHGKDTSVAVWKWDFDGYRLNAYRYKNKNGIIIFDIDAIQACLNLEISCDVFQKRSYLIIGKDGNRYTMLRQLQNYSTKVNPVVPDGQQSQSVWVLHKK